MASMTKMKLLTSALVSLFLSQSYLQAFAWNNQLIVSKTIGRKAITKSTLAAVSPGNGITGRREFWTSTCCSIASLAIVTNPSPAFAKSPASSQLEKDKRNIKAGYDRLNYLLDNWEKETTNCKKGDSFDRGCERTPEKVMEYLGYKSMEDPLFRADKTMIRLQELVPQKYDAEYQDALDKWVEKADEGNGMAFVSSWGEANPGGGKDRVALFIERSKNDVIACRDSLATVVRILDL